MSRIIIISEVFYPDNCTTAHILTKIASRLAYDQHSVIVISGPQGYDNSQLSSDKSPEGVDIMRLRTRNSNKNNIFARAVKFITLSLSLTNRLRQVYKRGDSVFIVTNPAPLMLLVAAYKRVKHFPLTILVHDVFPENTIPAGLFTSPRNPLYKILRSVFNRAYSRADRLIVLGRDMKKVMESKLCGRAKRPEILQIENWADKPVENAGYELSGNIKILYAGNIGRVQGLNEFIDKFNRVANPEIEFSLRGTGAMLSDIRRLYPDINYGGPFNKENQFEVLSNCDIALVTLAKGMYGLGVPSKTYNILAAGKPILFIGDPDSEIALLVREHRIGWVFASDDCDGIIKFLTNLRVDMRNDIAAMGRVARRLAESSYSEETILNKFANLY